MNYNLFYSVFRFLIDREGNKKLTEILKRTPIYPLYGVYGGKVIDFGGWELPVQFSSIMEEHKAVRERAGLFDVSHMGEVEVKGKGSLKFLQKLLTNDVSKLVDGKILYSPMCYLDGGTVDDLLVYRHSEDNYLLVINASNIEKDFNWLKDNAEGDVKITNISALLSQLALQGPLAEIILQKITNYKLDSIETYNFADNVRIDDYSCLISRTGYTGEDGFEIYLANDNATKLWVKILEAGKDEKVLPCGLGCRDTLRFEAKLPLYGQELSEKISPIEAGLGFFVKLDKGDFNGREVLKEQKEVKANRKLVGIEMIERGIPRSHYQVYAGDELIGEVTTGTQSPTFGTNIGLALIKTEYTDIGHEVYIDIRNKRVKAKIVKTPFYKRLKKQKEVFVELPELGAQIIKGESFGSIESVKAVSEIYSPINGTILEVNQSLEDTPELLNEDSYEKGWIAVVEVKDVSELEQLMSAEEYEAFLKEIE